MTETAYEIYSRGFGWCWRFIFNDETVATGDRHHDDAHSVRDDIDRLRQVLESITNDEHAIESTGVLDPQSLTEEAEVSGEATHDARFVVDEELTPSGDLPSGRDNWVWRLETPRRILAYSAPRYPTEEATRDAARRFLDQGLGSPPVVVLTSRADWLGTKAEDEDSPPVHVVLTRLPARESQ